MGQAKPRRKTGNFAQDAVKKVPLRADIFQYIESTVEHVADGVADENLARALADYAKGHSNHLPRLKLRGIDYEFEDGALGSLSKAFTGAPKERDVARRSLE